VIDVPPNAAALRSAVRHFAAFGTLKYVVLIGDVPTARKSVAARRLTVPTNYLYAKINIRWGSEPRIASDVPFADIDGDQIPDVAVGRIPADSSDELTAAVRKILRYERQPDDAVDPAWRRRLHVVAGIGGFGVVADSLIEAVGTQVFHETVPAGYELLPTMANPGSPTCPPPGEFTRHVCRQLNEGCLAWIYLGHGKPLELDRVRTPHGAEPILSVRDVPQLAAGAHSPLAVLVACYTGALDASPDCLAEELVLAEGGPVAVIAATRVTMPYGNTVFGCELLRACFRERQAAIGDVMRVAQRRTLAKPAKDDALRISLDSLAQTLSPNANDLKSECREHVWMYQLLGDPLTKLRRPEEKMTSGTRGDRLVR
jgi:hypothetical protein